MTLGLDKLIKIILEVVDIIYEKGDDLLYILLGIAKASIEFFVEFFIFIVDLIISNNSVVEVFILLIPTFPILYIIFNFLKNL